ncbi:MAG: PilT/PilU family type 4a pilus ATPase [Phycisphaerales bacterium]|jgi:twitching motility protein PilT|nr:PilT/PilU family type 4a pilus ATPase [Phycisphaerales bacterium]MBT7171741.1 PilT/PilU family type 4a pilus ATPase [Phycisphaerales bacterium]
MSMTPDDARKKIEAYFTAVSRLKASDLHIKTDRPAAVRIDSQLRLLDEPPLDNETILAMALSLLDEEQADAFHHTGNLDIAYQVPDGDRFRINLFRQRGEPGLAARRVSCDIPDFNTLHLPESLGEILVQHQGLVLLAGPTGSGKSTTIASMLNHINATRRCHILTLEDPIEYVYSDQKAFVNQREIGIDTPDFPSALRAMLREDPDVVLLGEMRDPETFEAALQAAETGHLVFGTIHASTAPQTISRITELFPIERRNQILQTLAFTLQAIVCQKLLPSCKEGVSRVPSVEIMRNNSVVCDLIAQGREADLPTVIRSSELDGMLSFNSSLMKLIETDMIDPKTAYAVSPNADELKMLMKGITTSTGGLIG